MLDSDLKRFMELMNSRVAPRISLKQVGLNKSRRSRVLLFATAGIKLSDYVIHIAFKDDKIGKCTYRIPDDSTLVNDSYICVYLDSSGATAKMQGVQIPSFHIGLKNCGFRQGDRVSLLAISDIEALTVEDV